MMAASSPHGRNAPRSGMFRESRTCSSWRRSSETGGCRVIFEDDVLMIDASGLSGTVIPKETVGKM